MKKKFSLRRIGLLLQRYFNENINREIMFWSVITLLFTILDQRDFVLLVMFISGIIFSTFINKDFTDMRRQSSYLLLPATPAEKVSAVVFLSIFYHFGMTLISYIIGNGLIIFIFQLILKFPIPVNWDIFQLNHAVESNGMIISYSENIFWRIASLYLLIQSVFLLGTYYFNYFALVKTVMTLLLLFIIVGGIQFVMFKTLWDVKYIKNAIFPVIIMVGDGTYPVIIERGIILGGFSITPVLWIVSYFRLSEKQVSN